MRNTEKKTEFKLKTRITDKTVSKVSHCRSTENQ